MVSGGDVKRGPDPRHDGHVLRPYQRSLVLRRGRKVRTREADIRCLRDVTHPVLATLEHLLLDPRLGVVAEAPDVAEVVTAGCCLGVGRAPRRRRCSQWRGLRRLLLPKFRRLQSDDSFQSSI